MDADQLLSLIAGGEYEVLEFKLDSVRNEQLAKFQQSAQLHYELTTLQDTDWQDLHLILVGEYLAHYRSLKLEDYSVAEQRTLLQNLALLRDDRLTLLGGLLFGRNKEN